MLVTAGLGVQLRTSRGITLPSNHKLRCWTSGTFIPRQNILDLQVTEGLHGHTVRYWLSITQQQRSSLASVSVIVPFKVSALIDVICSTC